MKSSVFRIAAAVCLAFLAASCSPIDEHQPVASSTTPIVATITTRHVCDAMRTFFANELSVQGLRAEQDRRDGLSVIDVPISRSATCFLRQNEIVIGRFRSMVEDREPTEGRTTFTKKIELSQTVWISDSRPIPGSRSVDLVTRVGRWNAQFDVGDPAAMTTNGPLNLTDEDVEKAARFLIEMTTRLDTVK